MINDEEKRARRRKNPREKAVIEAYEKSGWRIITRGFPCFLAQKAGQRPRFVWVERKECESFKNWIKGIPKEGPFDLYRPRPRYTDH